MLALMAVAWTPSSVELRDDAFGVVQLVGVVDDDLGAERAELEGDGAADAAGAAGDEGFLAFEGGMRCHGGHFSA